MGERGMSDEDMRLIDNISEWLDRFFAAIFGAATIYGAGGALLNSRNKDISTRKKIIEIIGGAFTANMLDPVVVNYVSVDWYATTYFLLGMGGVGLVEKIYQAFEDGLVERIRNKMHRGKD